MTTFTDEQLGNARAVQAACYAAGRPGDTLACLCCTFDESSLINTPGGDISAATGLPSTSAGLYQQIASWGPLAVRMDPAGATDLFLARYVAPASEDQIPYAIQAVQQSEFDGVTPWPGRAGQVYPLAQNYIDAMPAARQVLALIGTPTETPTMADYTPEQLAEIFIGALASLAGRNAIANAVADVLGTAAGFQVTLPDGSHKIDPLNGLRSEANAVAHGQNWDGSAA